MCVFLLMMTGCASSIKVSPSDIQQCKAVAVQKISPPSDFSLSALSSPVKYSSGNITRMDIIRNQTQNNYLWGQDRLKLKELQEYIKTLEDKGEIGR